MRVWRAVCAALAGVAMATTPPDDVRASDGFNSPEILVLGDSQISFGSGPVYVDFLSQLDTVCTPTRRQARKLKQLDGMNVGVIGVRSTSIHSWTARSGAAKKTICDIDPKWKVNAGTYGVINKTDNAFKQMGQGKNYQFCSSGKSPFETMFRADYYNPKLLILAFLGNASMRWASNPELAVADVKRLNKQLPKSLPCVFMTTAPAHTNKVAKKRLKAQQNIKAAFASTGNSLWRNTFNEGATVAG